MHTQILTEHGSHTAKTIGFSLLSGIGLFFCFILPRLMTMHQSQDCSQLLKNLAMVGGGWVFFLSTLAYLVLPSHHRANYFKWMSISGAITLGVCVGCDVAWVQNYAHLLGKESSWKVIVKGIQAREDIYFWGSGLLLSGGTLLTSWKRSTQSAQNYFGSAAWASKKDLQTAHLYRPNTGVWVGTDDRGQDLYLPLQNKLTLAPPGGGKTSCSSIPVLLSYSGPVFALDVKGELWATTARHRSEHFHHQVIALDPFGVTQSPAFKQYKPSYLLTPYHCNLLDWLPSSSLERDRMLTTLASSFLIFEGAHARHFDENAKILIRGVVDYVLQQDILPKNLNSVYHFLNQSEHHADELWESMQHYGGHAATAAHQIQRVGREEKGSILSTAYRHLDWLGSELMQRMLTESNFNLKNFLTGAMDIFVILPEDQIKEQGRFMRMLLSVLMHLFVQAQPHELPTQKVLFLLEELAQLGPCPDVEQAIEVLRARGVVVWSVFQSLSQIKQFQKPDLFLGSAIKQIFTLDDVDTLQWVQSLAGKRTITSTSYNRHTGYSQKSALLAERTASGGVGQSSQEMGVDLLALNELREMPGDSQLIFMQGLKPIKCKKKAYFQQPLFKGQYDSNPLEDKDSTGVLSDDAFI